MTTPPTIIPHVSAAGQRTERQCACCWAVVPGARYNADAELCNDCATALNLNGVDASPEQPRTVEGMNL